MSQDFVAVLGGKKNFFWAPYEQATTAFRNSGYTCAYLVVLTTVEEPGVVVVLLHEDLHPPRPVSVLVTLHIKGIVNSNVLSRTVTLIIRTKLFHPNIGAFF